MGSGKISYAGVGGAVAGVIGLIGVVLGWWETGDTLYRGTSDASGSLGLAMSLATFVFGGAYILLSDPGIRRAMGALMTFSAVVLAVAVIWGFTRGDSIAAGAGVAAGIYVSAIGAILGIGSGFLWMRDSQAADAARGAS